MNMHLDFNSNIKSNFNTYGRTDERYEERAEASDHLQAVTHGRVSQNDERELDKADAELLIRLLAERDSRISGDRGKTISQVLDKLLERADREHGKRWPVVRTGQREPISWMLRYSILDRDQRTCRACKVYWPEGPFELDHCIPWSAGGSDDSDNLRTLCVRCNQERSNFIDEAHLENLRPTTYWCVDCWTPETKQTRLPWKDLTDLGNAPLVGDDHQPTELVWCAHCHYYSTSDVYLLGNAGRELIEEATRLARAVADDRA